MEPEGSSLFIKRVVEEKVCDACAAVYCKRIGDSRLQWQKRRFCSRACAARRDSLAVSHSAGVCFQCGATFEKEPFRSWSDFRRRRYCSRLCAARASAPLRRERTRARPKRLIEEKQCDRCGSTYRKKPTEARWRWGKRRFCGIPCQRTGPQDPAAFWALVPKVSGGCWEWPGRRDPSGYGVVHYQGKQTRAHRLALELEKGPLAAGIQSCHSCDNPPCCRPDHLFPGTGRQNLQDAAKKGRTRATFPPGLVPHNAQLDPVKAGSIRRLAVVGYAPAQLAAIFLVSRRAIVDVLSGRTWKHIP